MLLWEFVFYLFYVLMSNKRVIYVKLLTSSSNNYQLLNNPTDP